MSADTWNTANYTEIDWLTKHVTGDFSLFERFRQNIEFVVDGIGKCKILDADLNHDFEYAKNDVWMVFELNGSLFKIEGTKSSYGTSSWNRNMYPVRKKEKVTYDYV